MHNGIAAIIAIGGIAAGTTSGQLLSVDPSLSPSPRPGPAVVGCSEPRAPQAQPGIFSFDVGEERRYALDPPELLEPGEHVQYLIRLESIEGTGADLAAKFVLESESLRFVRRGNIFNPDERNRRFLRVELTLNRHGFPMEIDYRLESTEAGYESPAERHHIVFDGDRYAVTNFGSMRRRNYRVRLPGTSIVDGSVPRGIFLSPQINPGLLSIMFTTLLDNEAEDFEYMETRLPYPRFRYRRYRIDSLVTIDVGGVSHDAVFLRDGPQGDNYMALDGTVLKVEIRDRDRPGWLRLLHSWEY